MIDPGSPYITTQIAPEDVASEFTSGKHSLDDYFKRHALSNHRAGIGRTYVLRSGDTARLAMGTGPASKRADVLRVLGYYTLSMALAESEQVAAVFTAKLPKYPVPVALIGRLAVHRRVRGQGHGEALLVDALRRVVDASTIVGCVGVIVDAKDGDAESFYTKYDFVTITDEQWPHRMFLALETARLALLNA